MSEKIKSQLYNGEIGIEFNPDSHIYMVNDGGKPWRPKSVTGIIGIKDKSGALVPWALEEGAKHLIQCLEKGVKIDEEQIIKAVFASEVSKTKAADLGTAIHDWIEKYIRFKTKQKGYSSLPGMPEDKNVLMGINSFLAWEAAHKVKYLWAEKVLYSKKYGYIGKGDFAAVVDGLTCLCDNKTSNGLYNSVRMQTAAYVKADEEETKLKYDGRWAIRVAKETESEYLKRMEIKNRIKRILGKKESEIKPYEPFQAVFLDDKASMLKDDFQAFLNCMDLGEWDRNNYTL